MFGLKIFLFPRVCKNVQYILAICHLMYICNKAHIVYVHLLFIGISISELNINAQIIFYSEGGFLYYLANTSPVLYNLFQLQESSPPHFVSLNIDFRKSKYWFKSTMVLYRLDGYISLGFGLLWSFWPAGVQYTRWEQLRLMCILIAEYLLKAFVVKLFWTFVNFSFWRIGTSVGTNIMVSNNSVHL